MMELLTDPQVWILLVTLSTIEIVLNIDNLVFISIAVGRLPVEQREFARKFGIAVACITRIGLLLTLAWLARLTSDLFVLFGQGISVRDLVLILGGLFLLVDRKSTRLNSSHVRTSYAVFCLKNKTTSE